MDFDSPCTVSLRYWNVEFDVFIIILMILLFTSLCYPFCDLSLRMVGMHFVKCMSV
jgi:hypothetical protein